MNKWMNPCIGLVQGGKQRKPKTGYVYKKIGLSQNNQIALHIYTNQQINAQNNG